MARLSRPPPAHVLSVRSAVWRTGRIADIRRHPGHLCKCAARTEQVFNQCLWVVPRIRPRPCGKIFHPPHGPRSASVPAICRESRLPGARKRGGGLPAKRRVPQEPPVLTGPGHVVLDPTDQRRSGGRERSAAPVFGIPTPPRSISAAVALGPGRSVVLERPNYRTLEQPNAFPGLRSSAGVRLRKIAGIARNLG